MLVNFTSVRFKNMLSSGNVFVELSLNSDNSTLILGANGQGKSTVLDALCFGLFKKPFRKLPKLVHLVNTVNNKDLVVEISFNIGTNEFLVRRGLKPALFEVHQNGALLKQDAAMEDYQGRLEKTIGFTYESFKQVAILGSASYTPFMQLKTPERREFVEQLLDIQVFSKMNELLKERVAAMKRDWLECGSKLSSLEAQIEFVKDFIRKLESEQQKQAEDFHRAIQTERAQIEIKVEQSQLLKMKIQALEVPIAAYPKTRADEMTLREKRAEARSRQQAILEQIEFYEANETCKQCRQKIEEGHKVQIVEELTEKKNSYSTAIERLEFRLQDLKIKLLVMEGVISDKAALELELRKLNSSIGISKERVANWTGRLNESADANDERTKLATLQGNFEAASLVRDGLIDARNLLDLTAVLLKDTGIKASIIKRYVPIITKLANKYLSLLDFFVSFSLDENFDETFKARHRDTLTYYSFSEGEKKRIDVALLFTMREIARLKNSAATNILFLDEVLDSSLDELGMDSVLKLIRDSRAMTNVFVISHRGQAMADKFDSVLQFQRDGLFSQVEKLAM